MDSEVIQSRLLRLSPTVNQKKIFKNWTDCSRFVFNWTIDYIRSCVNFTPSWIDIKKVMHCRGNLPDWCRSTPYQVKAIAIKEACNAFWKAKGRPNFRSRKCSEQSCFIPKSAISENGIYPKLTGKGLYYHEKIPFTCLDSRLIWRYEKWWICIPYKVKLSFSENQANSIAIDPGIRTFATFYSPDYSGKIAEKAFSRITKLTLFLDTLYSRRTKANSRKKKTLTKAIRRATEKISNLITELHYKTANFICKNFDVIFLPTFETKNMVCKAKRKINSKVVRSMLTFSHYKFKYRLKWIAAKLGKIVFDVNEAYTSKTHPETGEIKEVGSSKTIKLLDGSISDRDIVGARNIFIKSISSLVDTPIKL